MSDAHRRLLLWLAERGWSQSEAARALGCHQTTINKICNGKRTPGRVLASRIETLTQDWTPGPIKAADWDSAAAAA